MTIKTYRLPAAALLAAAVTVPLVMFRTGLLAPEQPQTFTAADGLPNADIAVLSTDEPWSSAQPRLQIADSLSGTSHGVALISRGDELRVTAGLRDLFDYYLSAVGELSLNTIRGNIQQALQQQLSGPALQQAHDIMNNYLAYKSALVEFEQQYQQPQFDAADWDNTRRIRFMNERQQALTALQDRWLGADVADVFFAFDRRLDNNTLARAEILNSSLNDAEKSQALVNLQAELPIGMQLQRQRDQQQKQLLAIDRAELSTSEKFQQRAEVVGEAAAQRLQALDQQRAQWQQRLEGFRQVVNQLQQANLAPDDYQREYQALLEQHFAAHERVRAQALTN
ncbi:lipase secretion chaperone [Bacterioplanoides sp.]|uniref:lipase secretion chaperone n=1 Tax=Bacterioplanoides sp. TaxID=2066072 RepID=UPI003AFFB016